MQRDAGVSLVELKVDGGAARNDLLMQFQADLLATKVIRPRVTETTALGAAYLAGLAVGYWESVGEIRKQWQAEHIFEPAADRTQIAKGRRRLGRRRAAGFAREKRLKRKRIWKLACSPNACSSSSERWCSYCWATGWSHRPSSNDRKVSTAAGS